MYAAAACSYVPAVDSNSNIEYDGNFCCFKTGSPSILKKSSILKNLLHGAGRRLFGFN